MKHYNNKIHHYKLHMGNFNCYKTYGFVPDITLPPWTNYEKHLGATPCHIYFNQIKNKGFHNLCRTNSPPNNVSELLGLGLNFCLQTRTVNKKTTETSMKRFTRDIRLKFSFAGKSDPDFDEDFI